MREDVIWRATTAPAADIGRPIQTAQKRGSEQ